MTSLVALVALCVLLDGKSSQSGIFLVSQPPHSNSNASDKCFVAVLPFASGT